MTTTTLGSLYLLPVPLADDALHTLPETTKQISTRIKHFFVENIRTARRYLKSVDKSVDIDSIQFSEINSKTAPDLQLLQRWLQAGHEVGMMSEAGCPAMADPGNLLAARAHEIGAMVVPLTGPSSMLLALMASGLNGQRFRFLGYLPIKEPMRGKAIKEMEQVSRQYGETQIFIETPYRNNQLMEELLRHCSPATRICLAVHISGANERISTRTVAQWKQQLPDVHKQPAIFLLQG